MHAQDDRNQGDGFLPFLGKMLTLVLDQVQLLSESYVSQIDDELIAKVFFRCRVALALFRRYETVISSSSLEAVMLKVCRAAAFCYKGQMISFVACDICSTILERCVLFFLRF